MPNNNRAFSQDVMAAILVFLNDERAGHVSLKKVELELLYEHFLLFQ